MTPAFIDELQADRTHFVLCWSIEKKNGEFIRGTEHDDDVVVPSFDSPDEDASGTYPAKAGITGSDRRQSSDMSVDNMEVSGALPPTSAGGAFYTADSDLITADSTLITADSGTDDLISVSVADIESGLLDAAPVQVILVNYEDPSMGYMLIGRGFLGEITRDSDLHWKTEVRGFLQLLSQPIGRTYGVRCDVRRFGDARCKVNLVALTFAGTVTAVGTRKNFGSSIGLDSPPPADAYFNSGEVTFITGANAGFTRQVKQGAAGSIMGNIILWDSFPNEILLGDAFTIVPGCDRSFENCKFYDNVLNFRGHGRWIPGIPAIIRAP